MGASVGLWIAFLSGLAWAGLDVSRKSLTAGHGPAVIAAGLSLGSAALFALVNCFAFVRLDLRSYVGPGLLSVGLSVAIQLLILESVRRSELSRTIPMLSFTPVATSLFGVLVLGELLSPDEWIGVALVFCGALTLGLSRSGSPRATGSLLLSLDSGAVLMFLAALCISAAAPFDKLAIRASTAPLHGLLQSFGGSLVLLGYLAHGRKLGRLAEVFRRRPAMFGAVLLAFAAIGLQFLAYRTALVGEVETIKRVVGLTASLLTGLAVFGERITPLKVLAVTALGAGTALMLLGATSS